MSVRKQTLKTFTSSKADCNTITVETEKRKKVKYSDKPYTTLKIIGSDPILVSKKTAEERTKHHVFSQSQIFFDCVNRQYFVFLNILDSDLTTDLQEILAFPQETKQ